MSPLRPPAVAGSFYPRQPGELSMLIDSLLRTARREKLIHPPKALIVPHAGYRYSGPIAASAYACLDEAAQRIARVVLLGPAHHVSVRGLALPAADGFETPLGTVPIDRDAVEAVSAFPQVSQNAYAHAPEHSLEVQLPFLQKILGGFKLVPFVVGFSSVEQLTGVLDALWGGPETLIVASSDLSHYLTYKGAQQTDRKTAQDILKLRAKITPGQACGAAVINGLLSAAASHGLAARLLDLRNSFDTAGDRECVVGYGAFVLCEGAPGEADVL